MGVTPKSGSVLLETFFATVYIFNSTHYKCPTLCQWHVVNKISQFFDATV